MARSAGIDDVELLFVGREANTVGLIHVAGDDGGFARFRVETINDGGQLEGSFVAFVIGHDAVARVSEPDGTVGMHREIVGGVELFALNSVYQHGDGAIVFGARQAARVVLAGEQPALTIAIVTIAVVRGAAKDADFSGVFEPTQDAVVGDVAPKKIAAVAEPHGPFRPAKP